LRTAALSQRRDAPGRFQPGGGRRQCADSRHSWGRNGSPAIRPFADIRTRVLQRVERRRRSTAKLHRRNVTGNPRNGPAVRIRGYGMPIQSRRRFLTNAAFAGTAGLGGFGPGARRWRLSRRRKSRRSASKKTPEPALLRKSFRNCCASKALPKSAMWT